MSTNTNNEQDQTTIDKVNASLTGVGEKLADNKKYIYWAIGAILVAGCFTLSYLFIYRNPRLNNSFEAYNKVEMTAMGNDSVAAAEYKKVAEKYSGTDAGNLAALSAAESLYNIGKYQEAVKYLDKFSTRDEVLGANAEILKGDCYVNLKKYDDAVKAFAKAVDKADKNPQIAPRALMKEAVVFDELKKYDQALACYEQILRDYPRFQLGGGASIESYIEREKARLGK